MIPTIDPQVKHVGVSHLRKLNADTLRSLEGALVICENSEPLAVIVTYEMFLRIQQVTAKSLEAVNGILDNGSPGGTINPTLPPRRKGDFTNLDAVGPRLSDGRGKVTRETRGGKR